MLSQHLMTARISLPLMIRPTQLTQSSPKLTLMFPKKLSTKGCDSNSLLEAFPELCVLMCHLSHLLCKRPPVAYTQPASFLQKSILVCTFVHTYQSFSSRLSLTSTDIYMYSSWCWPSCVKQHATAVPLFGLGACIFQICFLLIVDKIFICQCSACGLRLRIHLTNYYL